MFNYRSLHKLLKVVEAKVKEQITEDLKLCRKYESIIVEQQDFMASKKFSSFDEANRNDELFKYDRMRRSIHNQLIHAVKRWNGLSKKYDLPLIYEGDENNRTEISELANEVVNAFFSKGLQYEKCLIN